MEFWYTEYTLPSILERKKKYYNNLTTKSTATRDWSQELMCQVLTCELWNKLTSIPTSTILLKGYHQQIN